MFEKVHTICNLCGNDETRFLHDVGVRKDGVVDKFMIVECKHCGLVYLNPRPTKETILTYYQDSDYYAWQNNVRLSYKQKLKYMVIEELGQYPQLRRFFVVKWLRKLTVAILKHHVSIFVPYAKEGEVLDIGCGSGQFLQWLAAHGFHAHGVEISQLAAQRARQIGLDVYCGELVDAQYPDDFFDVVIANHVLEHVYDPVGLIREVARILKPNGLFIIGVPNIESYEYRVFGMDWGPLEVPQHTYHFSYNTLNAMLQRNNFSVEKTIGKSFFIPRSARNSMRAYKRHRNIIQVCTCLSRIYLWKYLRYLFTGNKKLFGQFITLYARKQSGVME